jgi:hypothetical protein
MNKKVFATILIIIGILIVVGGVYYFGTKSATATPTPATAKKSLKSFVGTKLSDSPFAKSAYLISTDKLSADTLKALAGFNLSKVAQPDGTTKYILKATNPEYQDQSYVIGSGQRLYFIELSLQDDANNQEKNLGDDHAVVIDSEGNIVSQQ